MNMFVYSKRKQVPVGTTAYHMHDVFCINVEQIFITEEWIKCNWWSAGMWYEFKSMQLINLFTIRSPLAQKV